MSRSRTKTLWLQDAPEETTLPGVYHNNTTTSTEEDVVYAETSPPPPTGGKKPTTWYGDGALHTNPVYVPLREHTSSSLQDYEVAASADATGEVTNAHTVSDPASRRKHHVCGCTSWAWQECLPLLISLVAVILAGAALAMVSSPSSSDAAPDAAASTDVLGSRVATFEAQCVSIAPGDSNSPR